MKIRDMYKILLIVGFLIILFIVVGYIYSVYSPYRISSEDARERIERNQFDVILDVRTDYERNKLGFYRGSYHIQSADLEQQMPIQFPDKKTRILVYCNTGHRARLATDKLQKLGYTNTRYISSGYKTIM